jgi:hypothetical protein
VKFLSWMAYVCHSLDEAYAGNAVFKLFLKLYLGYIQVIRHNNIDCMLFHQG